MSRQDRKGLGEADEGRLLELLGSALPADREPPDERVAALRATAQRHREEQTVALSDVATGVQASAELINHTWGVELLLTVDGLTPGRAFDATYRTTDGQAVAAGSFVGVAGPYLCRMNGAVLRRDLDEIEILDADGGVVMRSRLA
jgi:hypothetical protein